MSLAIYKRQVCDIYIRAHAQGLMNGSSGNASMLCPGGSVVITPSGTSHIGLTPEDMIVLSADGRKFSGKGEPSTEWRMHLGIYSRMDGPFAQAIVHTHSEYATAFAAARKPIPLMLETMSVHFGGGVPVAEYAPAGSRELAQSTAAALVASPVCLMANHGVVALGSDPEEAFNRALYVEEAARTYFLCMQLGGPVVIEEESDPQKFWDTRR